MRRTDDAVRAIARMARVFDKALADDGLSLGQFRLLAFLSDGEGAASALADFLSVSRPAVTSMVDGLVDKGWVTREHSPSDRRRVLHHLTEAGRSQLEETLTMLGSHLETTLERLDGDDAVRVLDGLDILSTATRRPQEAMQS